MIDDAFIPLAVERLPEDEHNTVRSFLSELDDQPALQDLGERGFEQDALAATPNAALEALTDPERDLGDAFAALADASETLTAMIEDRLKMRRVVKAMRATTRCEVLEVNPTEEIPDLDGCQLVFIDYYLDRSEDDGTTAERIAKSIEEARRPNVAQQIILMSSSEKVREFRKRFRAAASVEGAAFSFVAKADLDECWKVRAHLEMFARALPHSRLIAEYINAAKKNMRKAQETLATLLDDLDLGDFAFLQNVALRADGHPLGDYLSWLLSSHLGSLSFEYDLRKEQAAVDAIAFDEKLVSPVEPSMSVATFYHSALFSRKLGPLGPHPRAKDEDGLSDVPLVQLGDVFLDLECSKAVVILSANCDLAFAPDKERMPDNSMSVLLVSGTPLAIRTTDQEADPRATDAMEHGSEVYWIKWEFGTFRTVQLGELEGHLRGEGFDTSNRDRLRPLYALKLQQEFGNHILRVGRPVMPPVRMRMCGEIFQLMDERKLVRTLDNDALSAASFKGDLKIRITPRIAGELRDAVRNLYDAMTERLAFLEDSDQDDDSIRKELRALRPKLEAIAKQFENDQSWIELLGDADLPNVGPCRKLMHCLYLARGNDWTPPAPPAVVFQVTDPGAE